MQTCIEFEQKIITWLFRQGINCCLRRRKRNRHRHRYHHWNFDHWKKPSIPHIYEREFQASWSGIEWVINVNKPCEWWEIHSTSVYSAKTRERKGDSFWHLYFYISECKRKADWSAVVKYQARVPHTMNQILTEKKERNILHDKDWTFISVETSTDVGRDRTLLKVRMNILMRQMKTHPASTYYYWRWALPALRLSRNSIETDVVIEDIRAIRDMQRRCFALKTWSISLCIHHMSPRTSIQTTPLSNAFSHWFIYLFVLSLRLCDFCLSIAPSLSHRGAKRTIPF